MSDKTLLKGGCVLSLDRKTGNMAEGDVLIEGDRIAEIGENLRARDAQVVDATDTIVMPGFVDSHRHAWKSLFRNHAGAGTEGSSYGAHFQPDDLYSSTLIGLLGAAEAGITTVVDWSDTQLDDVFTDAVLQAHIDAGLRTVLVYAAAAWTDEAADSEAMKRLATEGSHPASTTIAFGPRGNGSDDAPWQVARELGLRAHLHVGSHDAGDVAALGERNLLDQDITLVHCTNLDDEEFDTVAAAGAPVALTPSNEMARGFGAPPIQKLIDRNISPGLGIGDEHVVPGDMFAQMRAAISLQHATFFDLKLAGKGGLPNLLTTRDVIRWATIDSARAAGLAGQAGTLAPGTPADIVVLRADRPNIAPVNDPIGAVVWGMDTSNLDWVFVGGRVVMSDGTLTADTNAARDRAVQAQRRVATAAGLLVDSGTGG